METLAGNPVLQLDPAVRGVFNGPYPIGIDPVSVCVCDMYSLNCVKYKTDELLLIISIVFQMIIQYLKMNNQQWFVSEIRRTVMVVLTETH